MLNSFGVSNNLFDNLLKPGEEIWILIPRRNDSTVLLYEDEKLIQTQIFD